MLQVGYNVPRVGHRVFKLADAFRRCLAGTSTPGTPAGRRSLISRPWQAWTPGSSHITAIAAAGTRNGGVRARLRGSWRRLSGRWARSQPPPPLPLPFPPSLLPPWHGWAIPLIFTNLHTLTVVPDVCAHWTLHGSYGGQSASYHDGLCIVLTAEPEKERERLGERATWRERDLGTDRALEREGQGERENERE
jgi:hypothetical protein